MTTRKKILIVLALASFSPSFAAAATLNVVSNSSVVIGQSFRADIALDTQGESANAIQGTVTFPENLFTFEGIIDGGSPVSLWVEAPREISSGTIAFSGIMPGGFIGSASSVVGVMLVPVATGTGAVAVYDAKLLRNDGQGSAIALTAASRTIVVTAPAGAHAGAPSGPSVPFTVPVRFTPIVAKDPNVYGGNYFLAFSTTDKGSGINHYEVAEVPAGTVVSQNTQWTVAASPYLLKDQSLSSDIYVRAVNNGGSTTVAKVPAQNPPSIASRAASSGFAALLAFILLVIAVYVAVRLRRKWHHTEV